MNERNGKKQQQQKKSIMHQKQKTKNDAEYDLN